MNHTSVPAQLDHEHNVAYIVLDPKPPEDRLRIELSRKGRSEGGDSVLLIYVMQFRATG